MQSRSILTVPMGLLLAGLALAGCSNPDGTPVQSKTAQEILDDRWERKTGRERRETSVFDLFGPRGEQGQIGAVNKYIWNAALETLDFLPVQSVDPFTGVISTGFGTPPGGGRAYRATILVSDPALDARSLNVALQTRSGPASAATVRAVEDAILTRARQLRAQDSRL